MPKLIHLWLASCLWGIAVFATCPSGQKVDLKDFIAKVRGTYQIESAGGTSPKAEVAMARVAWEDETGEALFTLPYCEDEICSPGYLSFPLATTEVCEEVFPDGHLTREMFLVGAGEPKRYRWQEKGGKIIFKNFQHRGSKTLEHVLVRKPG